MDEVGAAAFCRSVELVEAVAGHEGAKDDQERPAAGGEAEETELALVLLGLPLGDGLELEEVEARELFIKEKAAPDGGCVETGAVENGDVVGLLPRVAAAWWWLHYFNFQFHPEASELVEPCWLVGRGEGITKFNGVPLLLPRALCSGVSIRMGRPLIPSQHCCFGLGAAGFACS